MRYLLIAFACIFSGSIMAEDINYRENRRSAYKKQEEIKQNLNPEEILFEETNTPSTYRNNRRTEYIEKQQENEEINSDIDYTSKSSFVIGFGGANNTFETAYKSSYSNQYSIYEKDDDITSKFNLNLAYLSTISTSNVSLGLDFTMLSSNKTNNAAIITNNSLITEIYTQSILYQIYNVMGVINLELFKLGNFDFNTQLGAGIAFNYLNVNENAEDYLGNWVWTKNKAIEYGVTGKFGFIGNYNFNSNLALGVGAFYIFNQEVEFKDIETISGKTDYKVKNNGTKTFNLMMKYSF